MPSRQRSTDARGDGMTTYFDTSGMGMSPTHFWFLHGSLRKGLWRIASGAPFCRDGYAVVDDFGDLVEVTP